MPISKISAPGATPSGIGDWSAVVAMLSALVMDKEQPARVAGSIVPQGSFFNIGGSLYVATADTAISGTPSPFVKIAASGDSASAEFIVSLSGVAWNSAYKGYYDAEGNLYIFDERNSDPPSVFSYRPQNEHALHDENDLIARFSKERACYFESTGPGAFSIDASNLDAMLPSFRYALVILIGAGGPGGGCGTISNIWPAGGGGSGAVYIGLMKLLLGGALSFTVGAGGEGPGQGGSGPDGGDTILTDGATAGGGNHGTPGGASPGAAGDGGVVSRSSPSWLVDLFYFNGKKGGDPYSGASNGGAGAGAPAPILGDTTAAAGNPGLVAAGGAASSRISRDIHARFTSVGGAGAYAAGVNAQDGQNGGGGGGGSRSSGSAASFGGKGGDGKVIVILY